MKRFFQKFRLLVWPWVTWDFGPPVWREKVSFGTRFMLTFPKLHRRLLLELPCGCAKNKITRRFALYAWKCPEDHAGFDKWMKGEDEDRTIR